MTYHSDNTKIKVTHLNKEIVPRNSRDSKRGLSLNAEQVITRQVPSPFTISLQMPSVSEARWRGIKHTQTAMCVTAYCLPIKFRIDGFMKESLKWHPQNLKSVILTGDTDLLLFWQISNFLSRHEPFFFFQLCCCINFTLYIF